MQELYYLGCDWTDVGQMFLHQGTDIFIKSIDAVINITNLKAINNVQIPARCIVTILTILIGKWITATPCILEAEKDEIITT